MEARRADMIISVLRTSLGYLNSRPRPNGRGYFISALRASCGSFFRFKFLSLRYNPPRMNCPSCKQEIPEDAPSCPSCQLSFADETQRFAAGEADGTRILKA